MDVREKLVELLGNIYLPIMAGPDVIGEYRIPHKLKEEIADHLIANGVTVQEWVSVDDRLPEPKENAICINRYGSMMIGVYTEWGWMFPCYFEEPTHWMPMPELPKGE